MKNGPEVEEKLWIKNLEQLWGKYCMREDKWVIFGAGEAGISAFAILKEKISFLLMMMMKKIII